MSGLAPGLALGAALLSGVSAASTSTEGAAAPATCAPALAASAGDLLVTASADRVLGIWDLSRGRLRETRRLPSACRSLSPWEDGVVCTVGARGAVVVRPDGLRAELQGAPAAFDGAYPAADGALVLAQEDGQLVRVDRAAGGLVYTPLARLGRHLRDLSLDGEAAASAHENGAIWVGRWPDQPERVGVTLEASLGAPAAVARLGGQGLLVSTSLGRLVWYVFPDPRLAVPLQVESWDAGVPAPPVVWLPHAEVAVIPRGDAGPPLIFQDGALSPFAVDGAPVIAVASGPGGAVRALRCDGTMTLMALPRRAPAPLPPTLEAAAVQARDLAGRYVVAEALEEAISGYQGRLPEPPEEPSATTDAARLVALSQSELDAARRPGGWIYPLGEAELWLEEAEAVAPEDAAVQALRLEMEAVKLARRQARVRFSGISSVVAALGGLLFARWYSRREAVDRVLATSYNPFRQDGPPSLVHSPFSEHALVHDLMLGLVRNCVVVEAPAFSGKTALLQHMRCRLEAQGLDGRQVRLAWVGLRGVPEERFWTEVGHALARAADGAPGAAELAAASGLDRFAVEAFLDGLWTWEEDLGPGPSRVVLLMDDLDVLGGYTYENQRFRGLVQVLPAQRLTVLGAARSIRMGWASAQLDSPWFNIFQVRDLRPLHREEVLRFVERGLTPPFSYHPEVPLTLHRHSQGRPLALWHLCYATVEEALLERTTRILPAHVHSAQRLIAQLIQDVLPAMLSKTDPYRVAVHQIATLRRRREELLARARAQGARPPGATP